MFFLILIGFGILSYVVADRFRTRAREYAAIPLRTGLSGAQIADRMLRDHGIFNVKITSHKGELTDHYNPSNRTINLSEDVYYGRNVASAAIAAHETGHAVQHATAYSWLQMRSALVPLAAYGSRIMQFVLIFAFLGWGAFSLFSLPVVLYIVIAAQAAVTLFTLVTLPVEFDATRRGLAWLNRSRITYGRELTKARSALSWAASTYVVAALVAVTNLLFWLALSGSQDD